VRRPGEGREPLPSGDFRLLHGDERSGWLLTERGWLRDDHETRQQVFFEATLGSPSRSTYSEIVRLATA